MGKPSHMHSGQPQGAVSAELAAAARAKRRLTEAVGGAKYDKIVHVRQAAARALAEVATPGDLVLTVGAGDVTELAALVLDELRSGEGR